ncbi:hypothetical protein SRHO_G00066500 [Serrasalmus rhombeus]
MESSGIFRSRNSCYTLSYRLGALVTSKKSCYKRLTLSVPRWKFEDVSRMWTALITRRSPD